MQYNAIGEFNLIQQTQYTPPTPKYNFPPTLDTLPQRIIEISVKSLKKPKHPTLTPEHLSDSQPETTLIGLEPDPAKTPIAAIDVSSIKLGETETGILLALRSAIIWRQADNYRYLRLGPFPFHITEKNKNEICNLFSHGHQEAQTQEYTLPNILHVQTRLATLLERWTQAFANQTIRDGLILWDGSLMTNILETPTHTMEKLLKEARNRRNTILAFSKMTQLLLHGHRITDLAWKHPPPCLLRIDNYPDSLGPIHALGNIYVAKLTEGSCAFRLDVDKDLPNRQAVEAVQKLLGNDLVMQSYPETLRLAHIFSTFTANEVIGIQRCLSREANVKIVARPNVRRLLFGPYGKGPEG
jgi:hypothetical protein